jgi:hypothetical protein
MMRLQLSLLLMAASVISGCVTPEQQLAQDRGQCASFGFSFGTPDFANCMMNLHDQRRMEDLEQERENRWKAEMASIPSPPPSSDNGGSGPMSADRIKELAILRSGDTRFPVCTATSDASSLDISVGWIGKNCRVR